MRVDKKDIDKRIGVSNLSEDQMMQIATHRSLVISKQVHLQHALATSGLDNHLQNYNLVRKDELRDGDCLYSTLANLIHGNRAKCRDMKQKIM